MVSPTTSKRYAKLDGKPPGRPRGRHAKKRKPRSDDKRKRKRIIIPVNQRLGFRTTEWAALTGVSAVTVWRNVKKGLIPTIKQGNTTLIPRAFAIECGLITSKDTV